MRIGHASPSPLRLLRQPIALSSNQSHYDWNSEMSGRSAVIAVHGIGNTDTENGSKVDEIYKRLRECDEFERVDATYHDYENSKIFFESIQNKNNPKEKYCITELYWADKSPAATGYFDLLRQLFELALGARHVISHALYSVASSSYGIKKYLLEWMRYVSNAIFTIIFGPIVALNIILISSIVIFTLYMATVSIGYWDEELAFSHFCPWQTSFNSHPADKSFLCKNVILGQQNDYEWPENVTTSSNSNNEKSPTLNVNTTSLLSPHSAGSLDGYAKYVDKESFIFFSFSIALSICIWLWCKWKVFSNKKWPLVTVYWWFLVSLVSLPTLWALHAWYAVPNEPRLNYAQILQHVTYLSQYLWIGVSVLIFVSFFVFFSLRPFIGELQRPSIDLAYSSMFISGVFVWLATALGWTLANSLLAYGAHPRVLSEKLYSLSVQPAGFALLAALLVVVAAIVWYINKNYWQANNGDKPRRAREGKSFFTVPRLILSDYFLYACILASGLGVILLISIGLELSGNERFDWVRSLRFRFENLGAIIGALSGLVLLVIAIFQQQVRYGVSLGLDIIRYFRQEESFSEGESVSISGLAFHEVASESTLSGNKLRGAIFARFNKLFEHLEEDPFRAEESNSTKIDKIIIISHSQGTVIALDWLLSRHSDFKGCEVVFFTMGSPYSHLYQHYFSHYYSALKVDMLPPNFRWVNFFRIDDVVGTEIGQVQGLLVENRALPCGGHIKYWCEKDIWKEVLSSARG
jgi:hypothetical protein